MGALPLVSEFSKTKKGTTTSFLEFTCHTKENSYQITTEKDKGLWLLDTLKQLSPQNKPQTFNQLKINFENQFEHFELFWYSKPITILRDSGLLVL